MARRTKEEAEETRQKILLSALETFCEKGYSRSSLVDIAQRIGLTKGAVYWHFKNKLDLFCSLAEAMDERAEHGLSEKLGEITSAADVHLLLMSYLALFVDDPILRNYFVMVAFRMEWTDDLEPARAFFQQQQEEVVAALAAGLGQIRGELEYDPEIAAQALIAMVDGLLLSALAFDDTGVKEKVADAVDIFLRGLGF